jgi:predicted ATPase/signal transduction histidine kinase/CheY-like chemotaxis protein/HPt (histidine-containing phosphotransfer) domain-containing protein
LRDKFAPKDIFPLDSGFSSESSAEKTVTLRHYLRYQEISIDVFLQIAVKLISTLAIQHQNGTFHGNLSPDVLLINEQDGTVRYTGYNGTSDLGEIEDELQFLSASPQALFYLAPEQTGRLNRQVDQRADLFSLGVIFYEMLTGRLPIEGKNKLEWFHNLLAVDIIPPRQVKNQIPQIISDIVMKCLARDPDDRYQSAEGLRRDLWRCFEEWKHQRSITPFKIGEHDVPLSFRISTGFCGRKQELTLLAEALQRVGSGPAEIIFISGNAGTGKTRLIQQFEQQVYKKVRFFISGKFQTLESKAPYEPIIGVFEQLFRWVLSRSSNELTALQKQIRKTLGANASLVSAFIPYAKRLLGGQTAEHTASSIETKERLYYSLFQLLQMFAQKDSPLVLFLDDLQWADPGSLKVLESIFLEQDVYHVLLIGTYRKEEVHPGHILSETIRALEHKAERFCAIWLAPLTYNETEQLISAGLRSCSEKVRLIAEIVYKKTGGNPFFVRELLENMYTKKLILPNHEGRWKLNLRRMEKTEFASDIVSFLVSKMRHLPDPCKDLLRYAACIGNFFDIQLMSEISGQPINLIEKNLTECSKEGLIQKIHGQIFSFVHDHVRQTAYLLTLEQEKKAIHYRLGHLLLERCNKKPKKQENDLRDFLTAVNHLNLGAEFQKSRNERIKGAELNYLAGNGAKQNSAFDAAVNYFKKGLAMLDEDSWATDYSLIFQLNLGYLECQYLCGNYSEAEELYQKLLGKAKNNRDRTRLHLITILYATKNDFDTKAIEVGLQGLRELGHAIPLHPSMPYIIRELLKFRRLIKKTGIQRITEMPLAKNDELQAVMDLLAAISPCAYNNNEDLLFAICLKICELSMRYGHFTNSALGYMMLAIVCIIRLKDFKTGIPLGKAALALAEHYGSPQEKYIVNFLHGAFFLPWLEHTRQGESYLEKAKDDSLISRDFTYVGYIVSFLIVSKHFRGLPLKELAEQIDEYFQFTSKVKDPYFPCFLTIYRQLVRALRGQTNDPGSFSDDEFDEDGFIRGDTGYKIRKKELFDYYLCKNQIYYILGNYDLALPTLKEAERLTKLYFGEVYLADHALYYCLTITASYNSLSIREKSVFWPVLLKKQRQLKQWAKHCSANFEHKYLLVAAEIARIRRQNQKAAIFYEQAILSAKAHHFIQNAAIASECAAEFYFSRGLAVQAQKYMRDAYESYQAWGARAKTNQLCTKYPWLVAEDEHAASDQGAQHVLTSRDLSQMVDIEAIFRAAQLLSGEIVLENLLKKMMEVVVQNAGANRGILVLSKGDHFYIEAQIKIGRNKSDIGVLQSIPIEEFVMLPHSIVNYVAKTGETIVLDNASETGMFINDPYISRYCISSVICLPIVSKSKTVGVLYMENSLTAGAFTPERVEILRLLSSQMAVSIENARLYADLEHSRDRLSKWNQMLEKTVAERTRKLQQTNEQLAKARDAADAANRAKSDFLGVMSHEIRTPIHSIIGMAELLIDTQLDEEQRQYATIIKDSSELLLTVINDVLDFRSIEEGKLKLQLVSFKLPAVVKKVMAVVEHEARSKGIAIESHLSPEIPGFLQGDPNRLSQVLINLVSNAVKFTERGRVTLRVYLEQEELEYVSVRFEVEDTGIGIPADAQRFLFQPFCQADTASSRMYGGTGLGLAICKRLVDMMNGQIGFESAAGQGSIFWFTIPFKRISLGVKADNVNADTALTRIKEKDKSGIVLVVEDDPINQKLMVSQLGKLGLSAKLACNGKEAVKAYSQAAYAIILMDCQMPVMDGYETAKAIRNLEANLKRRTPIIATTASVMQEERENCLSAGMDDILIKPIRLKDLQKVLMQWLPDEDAVLEESAQNVKRAEGKLVVNFIETFVSDERRGEFEEMIGGDKDFLIDLVKTFLRDVPEKLIKLRKAFEQKDAAALRLQVHGMKSSAYLLGFTVFAELCYELESEAAVNRLDKANRLIKQIESDYCRLEEALTAFLKNAK